MFFNEQQHRYEVENEDIFYLADDGIIDFLSPIENRCESDKVIKAYNKISKKYDFLITSSTVLAKLIITQCLPPAANGCAGRAPFG